MELISDRVVGSRQYACSKQVQVKVQVSSHNQPEHYQPTETPTELKLN